MVATKEELCQRLRMIAEGDDEFGGPEIIEDLLHHGYIVIRTVHGLRGAGDPEYVITDKGRRFVEEHCGGFD